MRSKGTTRDGWTRVRFGDIAEQINDRVDDPKAAGVDRYVGLEHLDPGSLRVTRWGSPDEVSAQKLRFHPGDIIFGKRRAYQRKVAVADFGGICSAHAMVLREREEAVAPGFLIHFMASDVFMERAVHISVGSLSPTINWSTLRDQEFDLPAIEEQAKACQVLAQIENVKSLTRCATQAAAACLRSYLNMLFQDTARSQQWPFVDLASVAEVRTGIARHAAKETGSGVTVPYITVAHVQEGFVSLVDRRTMNISPDLLPRYELHDGDVLMTEGGDLDKLGRGTVWRDVGERYVHQNHVFAVRPDQSRLRPEWLAAAARSSFGRDYFLMCAKRTSNLASINKSQVSAFRIPLPPLALQDELLASLDCLLSMSEALHHRESAVQRLVAKIHVALSRESS